jgi:hypothetical protein
MHKADYFLKSFVTQFPKLGLQMKSYSVNLSLKEITLVLWYRYLQKHTINLVYNPASFLSLFLYFFYLRSFFRFLYTSRIFYFMVHPTVL